MKRQKEHTNLAIHVFFIIWGLICVIPFMIVISASFSSEADLSMYGFSVLPKKIDLTAYQYLFANPTSIINGYKTTIITTVIGTVLAVLFQSMCGYSLSRYNFIWKNAVTWFLFFPSLFSGGMVASYIVNSHVLHLRNTYAIMILPALSSFFHIVMFRTFFKQLPEGLFDAAKIDGANELRIYSTVAVPLSTPVIATVAFMEAMGKWNMWYVCQLYISDEKKYTLQYLLQRMMMSIQSLLEDMQKVPNLQIDVTELPGENLRMALMVVCIGPMMMVFPFFQKYFTKGMTLGAVKG